MIEHQKRNKSLKQILEADNLDEINKWLKGLPLLLKIKIKTNVYWIAHAGIPFLWDFKIAQQLSKEIQSAIRNDAYNLFENMWGDTPSLWNLELEKYKRQRLIINYFTRMRFTNKKGALKLKKKDLTPEKNHIPWFEQTKNNLKDNEKIIFGHWAALNGKTNLDNIIGIDTGCVWGNKLTAIRLEDEKLFHVSKK